MTVQPVYGSTGEFEDYMDWVVVLCASRATAVAVCNRLNKAAGRDKGSNAFRAGYDSDGKKKWIKKMEDAGDANVCLDYTGTEYSVGAPLRVIRSVKEL